MRPVKRFIWHIVITVEPSVFGPTVGLPVVVPFFGVNSSIFLFTLFWAVPDFVGCKKIVPYQGCQMVCFQTKNTNLGKFWRALDWNIL
jgi:hypothetical protein